jgi:hypothetical protein
MTITQEEKIEIPSIVHKQAQNFNKKKIKWKKWNEKEVDETRFDLGFILILQSGFHQNNNILLQPHWLQGLQIGLPSW